MPEVSIKETTWKDLTTDQQDQLRQVFYMSSSVQEFSSSEQQSIFFQRWLGKYLDHPLSFLFCVFNKDSEVIGYCTGTTNTHDFYGSTPPKSEALFSHRWADFPAHLHINLSSECRGSGIGSELLNKIFSYLHKQGIAGVFIVTSPESRNVNFYRNNGFALEEMKSQGNFNLLFMGRKISG